MARTSWLFKKILLHKEELKPSGHLVQILKTEAHTKIKLYYHKIEIFYILKGNAIFYFGDNKLRAQPGERFLCEPGEVHGVTNDTNEEFSLLIFKINAQEENRYNVVD
ncbi:MAG: cupin domain-containing protein [Candidatus Heimdallarchaeota archaeon]